MSARRLMMNDTFMKEKPVLPLLASMALPMVLSMLVNSLYNIVDSFFVAKISEEAMAALSLVYPVQNLINAVAIGYGVGINALVAFYLGAEDRENVDKAAGQSLLCAGLHGIVAAAVSIPVMPMFLGMFTADGTVVDLGVRYGQIAFLFAPVIMLGLYFEKLFQAVGRMKAAMASLSLGCISNILLDPFLIFGIGPFPEMGIEGAALATGIGQIVSLAVYLVLYKLHPIPVKIRRDALHLEKKMVLQLYGVGIPAILNMALPSLLISSLNKILAAYPQSYVVILGVYYKLQTFLYLPANGVIQGMRPIIGYNFGARGYGRVKKIYRTALCMCGAIMAAGTVLCLVSARQLIACFTDDPMTIAYGQEAFRVISIGFIASSVSVTSQGALEGLGKGVQSFMIALARYIVVILPAAFLFCRLWGPSGVWHAFWVTEFVTAAVAVLVYKRTVRL